MKSGDLAGMIPKILSSGLFEIFIGKANFHDHWTIIRIAGHFGGHRTW